MSQYQSLKNQHQKKAEKINSKYNVISTIRLIIAVAVVACLYFYVKSDQTLFLFGSLALVMAFLFLIKIHQKLSWEKNIAKELICINQEESDYLENNHIPFYNGIEYNDPNHSYSYDLDIFGDNSLFQNLNRTSTYSGESQLASSLLSVLPHEQIIENQQAIKELASKVGWRQHVMAIARVNKDSKESHNELIEWSARRSKKIHPLVNLFSFLSPIVVIGLFTAYNLYDIAITLNLGLLLFVINLLVLALQLKRVKEESIGSGKVDKIIKQYSRIISEIEKEHFESKKLNELKNKFNSEVKTSQQIAHLSSLFSKMDNIMNAFSWIFNGMILYHIHTLKALQKWKNTHANEIPVWLDIIGEIEALGSLGNFYFNNKEYTFPEINNSNQLIFQELGHPLIKKESMVSNSVSFGANNFFILTGSNMSGKSTFLRTLGINMILGSIGAPVCARSASIYPLPVLVSMRLSDSLNDSESYFFAEVKRLKKIMDLMETQKCFVLLDEILRGTNSDDKRSGTIGVIKKIISKKGIGAIATHDLEVCLTTKEFPEILSNKCFEVEIINNDLHFDYKLRDGICQNKSATFLMEKMDIISS